MRSRANPLPMAPRSNSSRPSDAENCMLLSQQIPLGKRGLCFQSAAGAGRKRRVWPRPSALQFAGRQMPAQSNASFRRAADQRSALCRCRRGNGLDTIRIMHKVESRLCGLCGICTLFAGDAHSKVRRHGAMVELIDLSHRPHFRWAAITGSARRAAAEKIRLEARNCIGILIRRHRWR